MIVMQNNVPEIYYNTSRDFQIIARALEVLANYEKTNVDIIKAFPQSKNFDIHLLTLLAYTLGFTSKHNYNTNDLFNLCATFSKILKYKGSWTAIELAVHTLLNAQQIDKEARVEADKHDSYNILIYLPIEVKDIVLLEDLFDYILPCGFTYSFIFSEFTDSYNAVSLHASNDVKSIEYDDDELGAIANASAQPLSFDNPQSNLQQVSTGVVVKPQ